LAARGMDMRILKLFFPVADMVNHLVGYQYGAVEDLWTVTVTAIILAIVFWMAGAMIFARRDVTISPE